MGVVARRLIYHWRRQGISLPVGCHPDSIREFERRNRVVLSDEMRAYFLESNGMGGSEDDNGFSFWPISRVIPVEEEVERHTPVLRHFPGDSDFFVFADYLNWSWAYAIRLRPSPGRVVIVGKESPEVVAESFEQFVDLYIADAASLYEGPVFETP